jgi:hypothetical protein
MLTDTGQEEDQDKDRAGGQEKEHQINNTNYYSRLTISFSISLELQSVKSSPS